MVTRVLVVYASADGSTAGIVRRIARHLREGGHEVSNQSADAAGSLDGVDAIALGSGCLFRARLPVLAGPGSFPSRPPA